MKKRKFWVAFFLVTTILTAGIIFFFSAQTRDKSAQLSDGIVIKFSQAINLDYEKLSETSHRSVLEQLSHVIRKCAHFLEFALLGFNLMGYLHFSRWKGSMHTHALIAWGLATLYAGTDELHQLFVSQRGPGLLDVGIDSAGALAGLLAMALLVWLLRRKINTLE